LNQSAVKYSRKHKANITNSFVGLVLVLQVEVRHEPVHPEVEVQLQLPLLVPQHVVRPAVQRVAVPLRGVPEDRRTPRRLVLHDRLSEAQILIRWLTLFQLYSLRIVGVVPALIRLRLLFVLLSAHFAIY
jgi:hypothetical protein